MKDGDIHIVEVMIFIDHVTHFMAIIKYTS